MKKSPLRRVSKSPMKKAKDEAWTAFSKFIRTRDPKCFTCGASTTEAGHFRHRASATYFNEQNVNGQCGKCNRWLHGNLGVYAVNLDKKYGQGTAERLIKESVKAHRLTITELRAIKAKYVELNKD